LRYFIRSPPILTLISPKLKSHYLLRFAFNEVQVPFRPAPYDPLCSVTCRRRRDELVSGVIGSLTLGTRQMAARQTEHTSFIRKKFLWCVRDIVRCVVESKGTGTIPRTYVLIVLELLEVVHAL
jgi:hypothetical protein